MRRLHIDGLALTLCFVVSACGAGGKSPQASGSATDAGPLDAGPGDSGIPPDAGPSSVCENGVTQQGTPVAPVVVEPTGTPNPDGGPSQQSPATPTPTGGVIQPGTYVLTYVGVYLESSLCCSVIDPSDMTLRASTAIVTSTGTGAAIAFRSDASGVTSHWSELLTFTPNQPAASVTTTCPAVCQAGGCAADCSHGCAASGQYSATTSSFTLYSNILIDEEHMGPMTETYTLLQ